MPLPPALAARLSKRGLLAPSARGKGQGDVEEEVIAEDYDDFATQNITIMNMRSSSCPLCPNKYNIHHDCSQYCWKTWVEPVRLDAKIERRRKIMLKKYPLPEGWREQIDPGTGRFYYWEEATGNVSWLSPACPNASISPPASVLREQMKAHPAVKSAAPVKTRPEDDEREMVHEPTEKDPEATRTAIMEKLYSRGRKKQKTADLDPMDPASYSEIPRGTWADGLVNPSDAKTGVDVTASGPLFQQRPYPSPGAVLRANAEKKKR